ncbi:galactose mutarotase-like protein [Linnemannia elongata AG-77]|uniref:Galactose mutarotase-like protein n=1 Tax=Linnemannia elongata AG-77 TaxID=1314771 RepID=A0A197JUX8_9FUNG|nr:galactose mutarotase-like protein [Linnemannia elongata AG-77]
MTIVELPPVLSKEGQGLLPVNTPIRSFILTDKSSPGMACQITNLGATLTHLWVPDNRNHSRDVILGFDDATAYRTEHDPYFGASVGRTANRIAKAQFALPDDPETVYRLDANNGPNSLHGGIDGFSFRIWDVTLNPDLGNVDTPGTSLQLSVLSDHIDQGFPGRLHVLCSYRLYNHALEVSYEAFLEDDAGDNHQVSIVSLTNHAYFNLHGVPAPISTGNPSQVKDHVFKTTHVASFLELDETSAPTGTVVPLDQDSSMDFRKAKTIGQDLFAAPGGVGYDHFYPAQQAIERPEEYHLGKDISRTTPLVLATVHAPESGIQLEMSTTDPGFQFYTANFVSLEPGLIDTAKDFLDLGADGGFQHVGKAKGGYVVHSAFCLEASRFPDAINHPAWRDQVIIRSGDKYQSKTVYAFSTI